MKKLEMFIKDIAPYVIFVVLFSLFFSVVYEWRIDSGEVWGASNNIMFEKLDNIEDKIDMLLENQK